METEFELIFRSHAVERMAERGISVQEVENALILGKSIENYPDDFPYPSRLVLGGTESRPIHVVVALDTDKRRTIVLTVYEPETSEWEAGFEHRRPQ